MRREWNSPTLIRTMSLMEHVGSAKVQVIRSWRFTQSVPTVAKKGVYPYKYVDDWEKFKDNFLLSIGAFYSKLNLSGISECNYDHAQRVWREFGMKDLGDCHDFYLKTIVLLLSSIFETFRMTCLEHYTLDPTHFYTSPRLAWQAFLTKTKVSLGLLTDPNMLLMFE